MDTHSVHHWKAMADGIRKNDRTAAEQFSQAFNGGFRFFIRRRVGEADLDGNVRQCIGAVIDAVRRAPVRDLDQFVGFVRIAMRRYIADKLASTPQWDGEIGGAALISSERPSTGDITDRADVAARVLIGFNRREREVLRRIYTLAQPDEQIQQELRVSADAFNDVKQRARTSFLSQQRALAIVGRGRAGRSSTKASVAKKQPQGSSTSALARGA